MIAFLAAVICVLGAENRLWFVDLELRGACAEVRLDCGPDGATHLLGPFSSGEDRRLSVPVPVRAPLGAEGLAALPLPRAEVLPLGAHASVRVLGWSAAQPALRLQERSGALLERPRPPGFSAAPRAGRLELLLVLSAGGFLLALRRRLGLCVGLALCAGLAALQLAHARVVEARSMRLLEWEAGRTSALSVSTAQGELPLPQEWLEVAPEGRRLEFTLSSSASGSARARGGCLVELARAPAPALVARRNDAEALSEVWTRAEDGRWRAHGSWGRGEPLGPETSVAATAPPGWLASALPPGRAVLLARTQAGAWLRCLGFGLE